MSSKVRPVPQERQSVTPYLTIKNAGAAIDFYKQVFGATEKMRLAEPDGKVGHAEIEIGNARIMISDEYPKSTYSVRRRGAEPRPGFISW